MFISGDIKLQRGEQLALMVGLHSATLIFHDHDSRVKLDVEDSIRYLSLLYSKSVPPPSLDLQLLHYAINERLKDVAYLP